jgi:ribosomal protein S18 acetylase RimI-like enzyme
MMEKSSELRSEADAVPPKVTVRQPVEADIPSLAAHFSEMQAHYGQPVSDAAAVSAATLACKPPVQTFDPRVLVALTGETVVGSIVMNVTFPAAQLSLSLYIRDLYIAKAARRLGVGRILVAAANQLRASQGFSALEWTTDSANTAARRLYEACGARQVNRTYFSERRGVTKSVSADRRRSRSSAEPH